MPKRKIILYELNEVPKKLVNYYVNKNPNSALAYISNKGINLDTITMDEGELHPWSTWPTVHRGVNNNLHNIRYINQDLSIAKNYKPIWELLAEKKIDVGIFGSLQSFPPIKNKYVKYYLPDTFAPKPNAFPEELELFQRFNLGLASDNKAISGKIRTKSFFDLILLIKKKVISKRIALHLIKQVIKEKINVKFKKRRSLLQNVISFEIFLKNVKRTKPSFCTYFTNHVAGMMHRYWRDLFPEEFKITKSEIDTFNSKSIIKAMDLVDNNLKELLELSKKENYDIWILSSMGQCAIDRGKYIPELSVKNINKFLKMLNLNAKNYQLLPAMFPDFCIEAVNEKSLNLLREGIKKLKDVDNKFVLTERYPPIGLKLNLILKSTESSYKEKRLKFDDNLFSTKELGLEFIKRDIGTGYHIPEGIFILYGPNQSKLEKYKNQKIDTKKICPTLLKQFDIEIPQYMDKPL